MPRLILVSPSRKEAYLYPSIRKCKFETRKTDRVRGKRNAMANLGGAPLARLKL